MQTTVDRVPTTVLAARLRAARVAAGMSQTLAAVAAGIDPGSLSRLERGQTRPSLDVLYRLACVLDLDDLAAALRPLEEYGLLEPAAS